MKVIKHWWMILLYVLHSIAATIFAIFSVITAAILMIVLAPIILIPLTKWRYDYIKKGSKS